jgi:hypothetical protein
MLSNLGDQAFIFSIPHDVPDFMCVARYGEEFQKMLVKEREKKPEDPILHVAVGWCELTPELQAQIPSRSSSH